MRLTTLVALVLLAASPARGYDFTLGTGAPGEAYDRLGRAVARVVSDQATIIDIATKTGPGSQWNIRSLQAGTLQVALAQSDLLYAATRKEGDVGVATSQVRALATFYEETLHLVARRDSGIASYDDLRGKRVNLGAPSSGTNATARAVMVAHGVAFEDVTVLERDLDEALEGFKDGDLDAFFVVSAIPSPAVRRALEGGLGRLVSVTQERAEPLDERGDMRMTSIFADDYDGLEEDIDSLAVDAVLCCRADLPGDAVFEMLEICFKERDQLADSAGIDLSGFTPDEASEIPFSIHPGAVRFYYEQNAVELPIRVYTGFYIEDIYDFDIKTQTFAVQGAVWFRWRGRLKGEDEDFRFKLLNGSIETRELKNKEHFGGWTYLFYEFTAAMRGRFELTRYPFDQQCINLEIQHSNDDMSQLVFVAGEQLDGTEADLDKVLGDRRVADWEVFSVDQGVSEFSYPTTFGSPVETEGVATFSRYRLTVKIHRILLPYLIKFMGPLLIIVLMAGMVFFIHPKEFEVQSGIVITALLSCVAFHITQSDNLPDVGYLVTADKFFIVAYGVIFLTLVQVVIENHLFHKGDMKVAARADQFARILFPVLFFGPIGYLIWSAA